MYINILYYETEYIIYTIEIFSKFLDIVKMLVNSKKKLLIINLIFFLVGNIYIYNCVTHLLILID